VDRTQRRIIIFRDLACIVGGLAGLYWQTVVEVEASVVLVPAFVSLILGPTGAALWAQRNSAGQNTTASSSGGQQPQEPQSSPQQP
jgi:hypothetical protein